MRALYQGEATITRADGSHVTADVTIWHHDGDVHTGWGGRALVRPPNSLVDTAGTTCEIQWPLVGDGYMAGEVMLSGGQVTSAVESYRLAGTGELVRTPAER